MEDNTKQPLTADASLYNGQPTDTGSSCPSARLTSCTPSIQEDTDGVSVENVPTEKTRWFVLRVSYGRILKAKEFVDARNIDYYVPMHYKQTTKQGKKRIITEPLLPSFFFVHTTIEQIVTLLRDKKVNSNEERPLLSFYFDHTSYRQDSPNLNPPLVIPDEAMNNFIRLTSIRNSHVILVNSSNIQDKLGDRVVVTEGDFEGIQGRVARIAGQQRVVLELFGGCMVATAFIPKGAMMKFEE